MVCELLGELFMCSEDFIFSGDVGIPLEMSMCVPLGCMSSFL